MSKITWEFQGKNHAFPPECFYDFKETNPEEHQKLMNEENSKKCKKGMSVTSDFWDKHFKESE